jgi:hypothetical protein
MSKEVQKTEDLLRLLMGAALVDANIRSELSKLYRIGVGSENLSLLEAMSEGKAATLEVLGIDITGQERVVDSLLRNVKERLSQMMMADLAAGIFGASMECPPLKLAELLEERAAEIKRREASGQSEKANGVKR